MPEEIERLGRSVVMVEGSSVGPLPKSVTLELIEELANARQETALYRQVGDQLRLALAVLDDRQEGDHPGGIPEPPGGWLLRDATLGVITPSRGIGP